MRRSRYTEEQVAFASKQAKLGRAPDVSRPGKPTDNAHAEASNARFRAERLGRHRSLGPDDARTKVESRRADRNEARPHGAIGGRPPIASISGPERVLGADRRPGNPAETGPGLGERQEGRKVA